MYGTRKKLQVGAVVFFLFTVFYLWIHNDVLPYSHIKRLLRTSNTTSPPTISSVSIDNSTSCTPKDRVMLLKTHKTGSSTVTNILNRYGNKKNLIFALPKYDVLFQWPKRLKMDYIVTTWASPNIMCNHARYSKPAIHHLFPKDQSTYISIVREPLSHYESAFNYFELWKGLGIPGKDSMEILQNYLLRQNLTVQSAKLNLKDRSRLLRNPQLYDLGLDFRYYQDATAVRKYIEFLEKEYDLVMVMEYFDESAVLLKRLMCWEMDDVIFIKHNERQDKEKKKLSPLLKANIKSWNRADFMLYDYFNKSLWKKIATEGPDFYDELARFRKRKQEVFKMCIGPNPVVTEIYHGKFVKGHGLKKDIPNDKKEFCSNLVKSELKFYYQNLANHKKRQSQVNAPGEFTNEFDKENDWNKGKDFVHKPVYPGQ